MGRERGTARGASVDPTGNDSGAAFDALLRAVAKPQTYDSAPLQASLRPGQSLEGGRLKVLRRLGGGMGVVYEAFDTERGEAVALKTLVHTDAAAIYRLKQEFRSLADVVHDNLVKLHGLFEADGRWFFTMELVEGERVDAWLSPDGALDWGRVRAGLSQLVAAVETIHAAGKLHRDLKPSNVLVDARGRVVVLDFGLVADQEAGGVGQTVEDHSVSGTPAYMSPEQAAGELSCAASDWYAVGVMLFEALTGRLPFEGQSAQVLTDKQRLNAQAPSQLRPDVPQDLNDLCRRLLLRDPGERADGAAIRAVVGEAVSAVQARDRGTDTAGLLSDAKVELVGRDAELQRLWDAYARAGDGHQPVVVLLAGESGIGKSALLTEFLDQVRAREPAVVLRGRCHEQESVPFKAFDALVDDLSRYLRTLGAEAATLMPRDGWALGRLFPVLSRLRYLAEAPERAVSDVHELRRRGFAALAELLGRIRDRVPVVLHIDDLQWGDADSTQLLLHLLRQADAPALLCVLTHRAEGMADNDSLAPLYERLPHDPRLACEQLLLGPLSEAQARAIVGHDVNVRVVRQAQGSPFLLRELSRAARAGGRGAAAFNRDRAAHRWAPGRCAGAAGDAGVARQGAFAPRRRASRGAVRLAARRARRVANGRPLTQRQPARAPRVLPRSIREAAVASMSAARQSELHGALAEALLAGPDPDPEAAAQHLIAAGQTRSAAPLCVEAAERALSALAFARAAELFEAALCHGDFDPQRTQQLRLARAGALADAGLGTEAAEAFLEAREHAEPEARVELTTRAGKLYLYMGHGERGRALLGEAGQALDVRVPKHFEVMLASIAYHRGILRVRGQSYRSRGPATGRTRERLALMQAAAAALGRSDQGTAFAYGTRYLRFDTCRRFAVLCGELGLLLRRQFSGAMNGLAHSRIGAAPADVRDVGVDLLVAGARDLLE